MLMAAGLVENAKHTLAFLQQLSSSLLDVHMHTSRIKKQWLRACQVCTNKE